MGAKFCSFLLALFVRSFAFFKSLAPHLRLQSIYMIMLKMSTIRKVVSPARRRSRRAMTTARPSISLQITHLGCRPSFSLGQEALATEHQRPNGICTETWWRESDSNVHQSRILTCYGKATALTLYVRASIFITHPLPSYKSGVVTEGIH